MDKPYDDSIWREDYKQYTSDKRYLELLENGPKSLSQSWLLGALYNEWKKMKGYDKLDPKENRARAKQLDKDIRGKFGRGATKATGSYVEKDDDGNCLLYTSPSPRD